MDILPSKPSTAYCRHDEFANYPQALALILFFTRVKTADMSFLDLLISTDIRPSKFNQLNVILQISNACVVRNFP